MADETTAEPQDDFDVPLDTPESGPPGTGTPTDATAAAAGTAEQPETGATTFPPELTEALRRERLPAVPGETTEAAYSRLATHLQGRNRQLYTTLKDGERARKQEMAELRASLDPILREHYRRQHQEQVEIAAAQIPDKETDPEGYRLWVNEEVLRRLDAYEQGAQEQALTAEQQEAERQFQSQLAEIDNAGYARVAEGLGLTGSQPDPEFSLAYDVYSEAAIAAARSFWPDASDDQIEKFVSLSQQQDIRRAEMNGADYREVMKWRFNSLIDSLVRRGYVTRAQAAAAKADAAAGGNGQPQQTQQAQRTAASPAPSAQPAQPGKSVVERMRTDAAAAQRRAPSAVPAVTRPNPGAGQLPDATGLDEDDYVEAAITGLLGSEEQRTASHRRSR